MSQKTDQLFVNDLAVQLEEAQGKLASLQGEKFPPKKEIEKTSQKVERVSKLLAIAKQAGIEPQKAEKPNPKSALLKAWTKRIFGK